MLKKAAGGAQPFPKRPGHSSQCDQAGLSATVTRLVQDFNVAGAFHAGGDFLKIRRNPCLNFSIHSFFPFRFYLSLISEHFAFIERRPAAGAGERNRDSNIPYSA